MKNWYPSANKNTYVVLAIDSVIFAASYFLAFLLRFEYTPEFLLNISEVYIPTILPVMAIKLAVFGYFGLHRGMWRYTSVVDLINILKASAVSCGAVMLYMLMYSFPVMEFSRSIYVIDMVITAGFTSLFRILIRIAYARNFRLLGRMGNEKEGSPVAVFKADQRGELLLRNLLSETRNHHYKPAGFIDNDARYNGAFIHGYPVLGSIHNMAQIVERFGVKELLVASRVDSEEFETISRICRESGVRMRVAPAFIDERHGAIDSTSLRDVRIEDLLSRDPVPIDYDTLEKAFSGRRILITGAGGSIGSQLARQIAQFSPANLILVDKSENYMHQLEVDMAPRFSGLKIAYKLQDITQRHRMRKIFEEHRPEFVFHAAAHKHVPMMERNKDEVILNNIGGMKVAADLSCEYGVGKFILISTDKAVNPTNAMGLTKRVCELYMHYKETVSQTRFLAVRFGNVLGSNGSVVPLFMSQIENRGPVTVTHPDMERFFMTIPEAVLLILQAAAMGAGGELYILSMGAQVKIRELAEKMIRLAGYTPGKDIDIVYTGLRPGEKLSEELSSGLEEILDTSHAKIKKVVLNGVPWKEIDQKVDQWLESCQDEPEKTYQIMTEWVAARPESRQAAKAAPLETRVEC